jgi:excisionase family DNA binding protein
MSSPASTTPRLLRRVPTLADLVQRSCSVEAVPREAVPSMLGELEQVKAELWTRLTVASVGQAEPAGSADGLLTAREAASILNLSEDYLYRNSAKLPFTVRLGRKVLFSRAGIERYIRQRTG